MDTLCLAKDLFAEAKKYIPGGVNSPVRAFSAVGGYPVFTSHASGSKIYGECDREFIDYCLSWGALILGHARPEVVTELKGAVARGTSFGTVTKLETELAKLIVGAMPSIEKVRLTNSGTEAVMGAVRLARAYAKKNKIIKFAGSYHGHADYLLTEGGSGQATLGVPNSLGVPEDFTKHTIVVAYNNIEELKKAAAVHRDDLAAIIVEPVAANCGVILPAPNFLKTLREVADYYNLVLIFDEVITGFRLSYSGASGFFDIMPDLTCLGKIIGGGLPIGAFGGKEEIMKLLAPEGGVYQAGTLSGNPIATTAAITTLNILKEEDPYDKLNSVTSALCEEIKGLAKANNIPVQVNSIGSMFSIFFANSKVTDYNTAKAQNVRTFKKFFNGLLKEGVYCSPSGFEANFLSSAHTEQDIEKTLKVIDQVFKSRI